jgi:serine kinase of HPr protein (carbohydrate metabolism regulator)
MGSGNSTIHASCVLVGRNAVLIRGPSGSGKSSLALALIEAGRAGKIPPSWLVADDRVYLAAAHGRLVARAPETIQGKIEVRGTGIREVTSEPLARVFWWWISPPMTPPACRKRLRRKSNSWASNCRVSH